MAKIVERNGISYWIDGQGIEVPDKYIGESDRKRDMFVTRITNRAQRLHELIHKEKRLMESEIVKYLGNAAKREGETWVGGTTIFNFSMDACVRISIAKKLQFDERLQIAKQKIDKCIESWSAGSSQKIIALVNRAFKVNAKQEVDADLVLGLREMDFEDQLWIEAMKLIEDSKRVQSTKTYFYFQKAGEDGKMETIVLDFAAL